MNKITAENILNDIKTEYVPTPKPELVYNNNFELLCAVMLSAQTTDKRVNIVTKDLFNKYPTPEALAKADVNDVITIIKSLGLSNNKANNIINLSKKLVENFNSIVPNNLDDLTTLPGVGRKTANVVLGLGFNIPSMPVDTHIHRMSIRFKFIKEGESVLVAEEKLKKYIPKERWIEAHHLLLIFGRYYCKSQNPLCKECKLKKYCNKK
jgi:endonuclease-3